MKTNSSKLIKKTQRSNAALRTLREMVIAHPTIRDHRKLRYSKRTSRITHISQTSMSETHLKSSEPSSILDPPTPGFLTIRLTCQMVLQRNIVMMTPSLAQQRKPPKEL
jgi:hypothetical protein